MTKKNLHFFHLKTHVFNHNSQNLLFSKKHVSYQYCLERKFQNCTKSQNLTVLLSQERLKVTNNQKHPWFPDFISTAFATKSNFFRWFSLIWVKFCLFLFNCAAILARKRQFLIHFRVYVPSNFALIRVHSQIT